MKSPSTIILIGRMKSRTECKKGKQEEKKEGEKEVKRERRRILTKSDNQIILIIFNNN